ncbi:hypothetical protein SmB9_27320 [Sphingosinicella microcystinivorans]|uniref:Uncharacterized protein n=1 Tax=Sphingosinicella microcystinivorans TaxID=335406 RepID=A0AAD1D7M8_SPHMI|nr:hypothetical protein DFR51_1630 [Sphingosinicella microcystinivorans]BBE35074.1 hypothetical protein SmB9_27320 [Sphingosinicella microcystinivorans]
MAFMLSATLSSLLLFVSLAVVAHMFANARTTIARALRGEIDAVITERLVTAVEPMPRPCPAPSRYRDWQPLPLAA